jgi:hypothetical protein
MPIGVSYLWELFIIQKGFKERKKSAEVTKGLFFYKFSYENLVLLKRSDFETRKKEESNFCVCLQYPYQVYALLNHL